MKNRLLLLFILPLFLTFSATFLHAQDSTQDIAPEEDYEVDGPMAYGMRCAIFFGPTDMELENISLSIEDVVDIDDLEEEDSGDLAFQGKEWLQARKIKVYETDAADLYFLKTDGKLVKLSRDTLEGTWGIVFFDPQKDPIQVRSSEISEEGAIYFGIEQQ